MSAFVLVRGADRSAIHWLALDPELGPYAGADASAKTMLFEAICQAADDVLGAPIATVWDNGASVLYCNLVLGSPTVTGSASFEALGSERVWLRVSVSFGEGRVLELGPLGHIRIEGAMQVDVKTDLEIGANLANRIAAILGDAARDFRDGELRFGAPSIARMARVDDVGAGRARLGGRRWQVRVSCPFSTIVDVPTPIVLSGTGLFPLAADPEYIDASQSINSRWQELIEDARGLPTAYDNFEHDPDTTVQWARLSVLPGESFRVEGGVGALHRTPGIVQASIFSPLKTSVSETIATLEAVHAAFAGVADADVRYGALNLAPAYRDGGSWRLDISIPFSFDEH